MAEPRSLAELQAAVAAGKRCKYVFFWGHTPRGEGPGPWCFSQWWGAPFIVDGIRYPTAEHFMMAEKARLFGDMEARDRILRAGSPAEAKAIGREVRGFDQRTWEKQRFSIVVSASVAKFGQHSELRDYLVGTKTRVLVEASPKDRIWGIGLAAEDPGAKHPLQWKGLNLLGFALMEARSQLRIAPGAPR